MSTPIKREDIKAGDKFRRIVEITAGCDFEASPADNATYELIERPVQLPTEPGHYIDKNGNWAHLGGDGWNDADEERIPESDMARFAPFTRLRPVAEVAAEVLADIRAVSRGDGGWYEHQLFERDMRVIEAKFGVTK